MFNASLAKLILRSLICFPGIQNPWVGLQFGILAMRFKRQIYHQSLMIS